MCWIFPLLDPDRLQLIRLGHLGRAPSRRARGKQWDQFPDMGDVRISKRRLLELLLALLLAKNQRAGDA